MMSNTLRVTEIFHSLQGESVFVGCPTVFVRLTGCPLRCQYCDTAYAFKGGQARSLAFVLEAVSAYNAQYVCVTGGEPLAQPACLPLLKSLADQYPFVSLETSGALPIAAIDPRVCIVMDIKTPDSKESEKNMVENLQHLKPIDQIKFVLCSRDDYEWAKAYIHTHQLLKICVVLFSPSWDELEPTLLANWILEDQLAVRFQVQLHKVLWQDARGR